MSKKPTPFEAFEILKQDIGKCYEEEIIIVEEALKEIKKLEEELGIDLATLFKALRSGIHIIDDGIPYDDQVNLIYTLSVPCGFKGRVSDHCVFFKDYGRTWCLTKKELGGE